MKILATMKIIIIIIIIMRMTEHPPASAKLIDIYRNRHNITASTGMRYNVVATTGISELIYEVTKPAPMEPDNLDDDLVNDWATGLADDGLRNNASAMNRVNQFLAGSVPMHLRLTVRTLYLDLPLVMTTCGLIKLF